jgi:DNA-binding protein H-NS
MPKQSFELRKFDVSQLLEFRKELETVLAEKITRERGELQSRLAALDSWQGAPARRGRKRRAGGNGKAHPLKGVKAPIKYRGPNGETWSGRGLAPRWLSALEKKGKKRDTFLVAAAT